MKKTVLSLLLLALLAPSFAVMMPTAKTYDHENTYVINGFDVKASGITVYPNNTDKPRVITAEEYNFRYSKLMIFNKDGLLIEAGGDLVPNTDGVYGSCQLTVTVPPKGFLVAFNPSISRTLRDCLNTAMEGAMLYNATMSIIYPVYGSYDKDSKILTLCYNDPVAPSPDAPTYLFVGNSTTYFNGTPIKFKAMAAAAGKEIVVEYCTFGSAYLSEFADPNHERGQIFRSKLSNKKYDYIVFQDAASADYYKSKAAMDVLMPLVEANGAQALLYMRYSTGDEGTKRHYGNYPRLAKDFDLPVANVTGAFNICREEYPEINLLADDGGHHSCEGSYLIAATWLEAFMGIDPRGNSYTANLPEDVVEALQDCAVKVADESLELPEEDTSLTIDGKKYPLISKDKNYTSDGQVYSGDWTDADASGKPVGKRTDGNFAPAGDSVAIGCWSTSTGTTSIVIDLEKIMGIKAFRTDLWGGTWGIPNPAQSTVSIAVSTDGKSFKTIGEATPEDQKAEGEWNCRLFTLTMDKEVNARYVMFTYTLNDGNKKFCWSSECAVYGGEASEEPPKDDPDVSDPDTSDPDTSEPGVSEPEESEPEESTPETSEPAESTPESETPAESTPAAGEQESLPGESSAAGAESKPQADASVSNDEGGSGLLWILAGVAAVIAAGVTVLMLRRKKQQ